MLTGYSVSSEHETEVKWQVTRPQCDEGRRMDVYECMKSTSLKNAGQILVVFFIKMRLKQKKRKKRKEWRRNKWTKQEGMNAARSYSLYSVWLSKSLVAAVSHLNDLVELSSWWLRLWNALDKNSWSHCSFPYFRRFSGSLGFWNIRKNEFFAFLKTDTAQSYPINFSTFKYLQRCDLGTSTLKLQNVNRNFSR